MKNLFKKIVVLILTWEARAVLAKHKPKVVAVTGSVGKTGTKDAIYTILASTYFVRKSEKSFNSEIGVPLTILGLPNAWNSPLGWLENIAEGLHMVMFNTDYPEWLVLECGADRPGDLKALSWIHPHTVVYTRFPKVPVHVEFFESPEAVITEKRELCKALRSMGTLIVNADDPQMQQEQVQDGQRVLSYGFGESASVRGIHPEILIEHERPVGMACSVQFQTDEARIEFRGALGVHSLYPLLAAITVAVSEGQTFLKTVEYVSGHQPQAGRMRILEGAGGTTIIDDTYNASPVALKAGLETLDKIPCRGKKVAVLGDMMELGDYSVAAHEDAGMQLANVADVFIAVGVRMRNAAEKARGVGGRCKRIETTQEALEALTILNKLLAEGDTVYLKGSQSVRMERLVEQLLREPASAPAVLVRQNTEWKER